MQVNIKNEGLKNNEMYMIPSSLDHIMILFHAGILDATMLSL